MKRLEPDPRILWALRNAETGLFLRFRPRSKGGFEVALDGLTPEERRALAERIVQKECEDEGLRNLGIGLL